MPSKAPQNAQKKCDKSMGEGDLATTLKHNLSAIGNRTKQTTETHDKELLHECNIEKGGKIPAGRPASFSLCK